MSTAVPAPSSAPTPTPAPTPAAAAATIAVSAQALPVTPGQTLAARVIAVQAGLVELALAGGVVTAASDLPLEPGQTLRLVVDSAAADRVTLRVTPEQPRTGAPTATGGPAAALIEAGIPASAASTLLATLAEEGAGLPTGAAAPELAARAAAAGVTTPAQAAAFARLAAAGLPTSPAAVAGLAQLIEGPPLGRALATLIDAAATRVAAPAAALAEGPVAALALVLPAAPALLAPLAPLAPLTAAPSGPVPSATPTIETTPTAAILLAAAAPNPAAAAAAQPPPPPGSAPHAAPASHRAAELAPVVEALARILRDIESGAVDGRPDALRRAIADLGSGLEHRLANHAVPEDPPLRSLLLALANHPAADAPLARSAASVSDALSAQGLAGSIGQGAGGADPTSTSGAYLQLPLPGGGTAEVRVSPDAGGEGAEGSRRPRRLAFLLHLSALGPVMIEASAGGAGVDATVRVGTDEARAFLTARAAELAEGLRRSAPAASVSVERMHGPTPERLLAAPAPSGLDARA